MNQPVKKKVVTRNASNSKAYYTSGSTAKKINQRQEFSKNKQPQKRLSKKAIARMNFQATVFSVLIMTILGFLLAYYIKLNADVNVLTYNLKIGEENLYELQKANDEYYERIISNIDLEEIRYQAINEWGMKPASEEQIVFYDSQIDDYIYSSQIIK